MKNKLKLVEMVTNTDSEIIEDVVSSFEPDYSIVDVTVISDDEFNPTVQDVLIHLEETQQLSESQDSDLSINVLSETYNPKTKYSNSLFEFESKNNVITLSLALTESDKHPNAYNVSAYTTKGEKIFEANTINPEKVIKNYLHSLSNEYLIKKEVQ